MTMCAKCQAGPAGIEGHDALFTARLSGSQMQFKCRSCETLWTRTPKSGGGFDWAPSKEGHMGIATPGRVK